MLSIVKSSLVGVGLRLWRSWRTQINETPIQILKLIEIDVQLFAVKFYRVAQKGSHYQILKNYV